ncbi:glycylpeptide N-tetradecanoyltransferase [Coccinella septempunctata]|uniref:glycylpeptide N-tetradecanoyltransferase n=1 Tax=Coccinella septempunctata TaxID=41139 RepID=UPI001D092BFE|nr:glycylpeptide N-tetradecanoyltransferase [Coccinella septempunctata]
MSENSDKSNLDKSKNGFDEKIASPPQSKSSKKRNRSKKQQENRKVENIVVENGTQEDNKISKKDLNKAKKEVKADDLRNLAGADNTISIKDLRAAMEALTMAQKPAKTTEEALNKQFQFWKTQPVPQLDEEVTVSEAIEPDKDHSDIRKEPYSLPEGFQWDTLNLQDPLVLKELYNLLNENYVEDDDAMFRFDYQPEFLQWALQPPGWKKEWLCGVRVVKSGRLVGFISAVPATLHIKDIAKPMVEINFLCVHKKLRSKRVAPVLIREITRRVHLEGLFQAVYTAGIILPKPVTSCRYWHRSLNPKKLIDVKFSHLSRNMTLQRTLKLYKLPDSPRTPGFRKMTKKDLVPAHKLLSEYLRKFSLAPEFSLEEFTHFFLPRPNIVDSFVVEREGKITDFVSYYTLPSTIMHHAIHKFLKAAYSFYNVSTATPWVDLMNDALISAKSLGFDVFNALDLMDNKEFLEPLKFGIGDGNLQYYLYNWKCPNLKPQELGLVLH